MCKGIYTDNKQFKNMNMVGKSIQNDMEKSFKTLYFLSFRLIMI